LVDTTRPSLLARLKDRRDVTAWETFDEVYRPILLRFAASRGLDHADAEDVVQQCMAAIQDHIQGFDYDPQKGRFKGWLRTMVNNKIRNFLRDRRERQGDSRAFAELPSQEESPEEAFEKLWMQEHLWHCLRQLRGQVEDSTFLAFQRYVMEQWPIERVCAELQMKPNQVYTIKWRMTEKIAAKMSELIDDSD